MKKSIFLLAAILFCLVAGCSDDDAGESGWYIRMTIDGVERTYTGGLTDLSTGTAAPAMINSNKQSSIFAFRDPDITSATMKSTGIANYMHLDFTNITPGIYSNGTTCFYSSNNVWYHAIGSPVITLTEVGGVGGIVGGSFTVTLSNEATHQLSHVTDGRFRSMRATVAESDLF